MTNLSGMMCLDELGSIRRLSRPVNRSNFNERYLQDITSFFDLASGQVKVLKYMLSSNKYKRVFKYDELMRIDIAEACDMSPTTVSEYFKSLANTKKLITKVRYKQYKLNDEFLFHQSEIDNADFLGIQVNYVFDKQEEVVLSEPGQPKVTMEMINKLIEMYNKQEEKEKQAKGIIEKQ